MITPTEAAEIELLRAECSRLVSCPAAFHYDGCAYNEAPGDLSEGPHNRPGVGEVAYLIGEHDVDGRALLHGLHGTWGSGTAILCWLDRKDPPEWGGQAFRADMITSNPRVARASRRELRENGWNVR